MSKRNYNMAERYPAMKFYSAFYICPMHSRFPFRLQGAISLFTVAALSKV
jgi:hypothetical protein